MQSSLHIERRLEAGFLHSFRAEDRLSTEFFYANGIDRVVSSGDECQQVETIAAKKSEPVG